MVLPLHPCDGLELVLDVVQIFADLVDLVVLLLQLYKCGNTFLSIDLSFSSIESI